MLPKATDVKTLRKYLLGELPQEEQEALELWLVTDNDAYDLLAAAEDDLIDDSIAGRLDSRELDLFRSHFLAATERQRKLQFGQTFQSLFVRPDPVPENARVPSFWEQAVAFFRYRPALASAGAAFMLLAIIGGGWTIQLQGRLNSATAQMTQIQQQHQDLQRQLDESRAESRRITEQFSLLNRTITGLESLSNTPALVTLNLVHTIRTRNVENDDTPTAVITAKTQLLKFLLKLPDNTYSIYRVTLADDGGQELWREDQLRATDTPDGKVVALAVPTEDLPDGDYRLKLMGIDDPAAPEDLANYYFRAEHQVTRL